MTTIFPCCRCPLREGCEQRAAFRAKVSGLGLQSAGFRCHRLKAEIRVGRRIVIMQPYLMDENEYSAYERTIHRLEVKATITKTYNKYCFVCTVDPGQHPEDQIESDEDVKTARFRRKQTHHRIVRFLDEPDATVCEAGNVQRDGACDNREGCLCAEQRALFAEFTAGDHA